MMARLSAVGKVPTRMSLFLEARNAFTGFLARNPAYVEAVQVFRGVARGKLEQQGFRIGHGAGAGTKKCRRDLPERGIDFLGGVNAMDKAGQLGLFGAEAIAGEQIASQKSRPEGGLEERHQRRRRESQPHFGDGEERIRRRQHHVTTGCEAEANADAGAVYDGDGRFGKRIQPMAGVVDGGTAANNRRCVSTPIGADFCTVAKVFSFPAQDNEPNRGVGIQPIQCCDQQSQRLTIQRIALVGTVQCDRNDAEHSRRYHQLWQGHRLSVLAMLTHEHPSRAVAEAAVIGVPVAEWGEAVKAFVVMRDAVSADDLIARCRANIASYKKRKSIDFVEALPRLFNGKIDKKALRAPFWPDATRQVS